MSAEPSPARQFFGLLWAIVLTLGLAIVCRLLPGGIGDRTGGGAVRGLPDA